MSGSALYYGIVTHHRLRPVRHELRYRVFSLLLDLDELPQLAQRLRLFSRNRFNLFAFYDRDHGRRRAEDLRPYVESQLARAEIFLDGGAIRLLAFPRMLGYVFNPLSIYYCHGADGRLRAILYEVSNTFGEQHSYLIPVTGSDPVVRQSCGKEFYVSPFMEMADRYEFRLNAPDETIAVYIRQSDRDGPILHASLAGTRAAISDATLMRACLSYPLMTIKVIGGIHWEALRLWRKGVAVRPHPAPPPDPVTIVCQPAEP